MRGARSSGPGGSRPASPRCVVVRLLALTWAAGSGLACTPGEAQVTQPLRFSHRVHAEEDLACIDCHQQAEDAPYATLPKDSACMLCHEEAQGEDPAEAELLAYAEREEPVPWVQVNRLAGHVYFSHGVHVRLAELDCSACHGEMAELDEPVSSPQIGWLTMEACMDCHRERGASNDCLACHK